MVRALPPDEQIAKVMEKLKELNPMIPEKVFSSTVWFLMTRFNVLRY